MPPIVFIRKMNWHAEVYIVKKRTHATKTNKQKEPTNEKKNKKKKTRERTHITELIECRLVQQSRKKSTRKEQSWNVYTNWVAVKS